MSDFERSLLNAIKEEFSSSKIQGCFFHFVKALWQKSKKLDLTKSKHIKTTKILVFASKLYPLILDDNKNTYINNLYEYANSLGGEYNNFVKYFKKNWENSNFLNFDHLTTGEIINRNNNYCESFHNKLNNSIDMPIQDCQY